MSAALKTETYEVVKKILSDKLDELDKTAARLQESKTSEDKSSAGDKHETGRAMMHLEEEKLARQRTETISLTGALQNLNPKDICQKAVLGALLDTSRGWFYLSVGLGKIDVGSQAVVVISLGSPIGHLLFGTEAGDSFTFNGNKFDIKGVS